MKQTTLDLNGPILSFVSQPSSVSICNSGIATFVGIATASFPTQTPTNPATNTGSLSYQWYAEGYGALSDGSFLGATVTGSGTTTLTIVTTNTSEVKNVNFYVGIDYSSSAYGLAGVAVTVGSARSTGNAINEILISDSATLSIYPDISVITQPTSQTAAQRRSATFTTSASTTDGSSVDYQWTANGIELSDGTTIVPTLSSESVTSTQSASGFNGSGIYLDLTSLSGTVSVTISTSEESGIFHYINIPGVDNIPENAGSRTYNLEGGRIYGPCSAPNGNLYIGTETPVGGSSTLVVEEGGDDWNDMILSVNQGYFRRLTSSPTVTITQSQSTSLVNAEDTVSGSKTNTLTLSSNVVGIQTVRCIITHPTACNSPIFTNTANFNVVSARAILNYEEYNDSAALLIRSGSQNIFDGPLTLTADPNNPGRAAVIYAPEKGMRVRITLAAAAGQSRGGQGGEGGVSVFEYDLLQNTEYLFKLGSTSAPTGGANGGGGGAFFYNRARVVAACGGGGAGGSNARGGFGGGMGIGGENGQGRAGGRGGQRFGNGELPVYGFFPGGAYCCSVNWSAPTAGRLSSCTIGNYYRDRVSPCSDLGVQRFVGGDGQVLNSSALILRGYKSGVAHRNNGGNGSGAEGGGGAGAYGGDAGGGGGSGGGGASGYSNGEPLIISTRLGGNSNTNAYTIIELVS